MVTEVGGMTVLVGMMLVEETTPAGEMMHLEEMMEE